ncbi:uncharacterized protein LOC116669061 [Camelus ferus]|uniref:Uncharacterized protein LOC116669061 n=1 Tax=Camelus ferus TaxID=419612 RepID=A0A8B8UHK2_CAMFR|nr:uncharacterized protein LOC116669061 [Camelus ferus]
MTISLLGQSLWGSCSACRWGGCTFLDFSPVLLRRVRSAEWMTVGYGRRRNLSECEGSRENPTWCAAGTSRTPRGPFPKTVGSAVAGNAPPDLNLASRGGARAEAAPRSPSGRDRLRNRFADGGQATERARRRLPSRISRGPPAPRVPRGAGSRCDVRDARRARQVSEPSRRGCRRVRGRCGRRRVRRGRLSGRAGRRLRARHDTDGPSEPRRPPS